MQKEAHIHVVSKNLYSQDAARTPAPFGVLDPKLVRPISCICLSLNDHHFSTRRVFVVVSVCVKPVIKMLLNVLAISVISIFNYLYSILDFFVQSLWFFKPFVKYVIHVSLSYVDELFYDLEMFACDAQ